MSRSFQTLMLLVYLLPFTTSSDGDRSPFYQNCIKSCTRANCTAENTFLPKAAKLQDKWSKLLFWNCKDECRYHCMWRTVNGFQEKGFEIPKFHGKWPFKRVLGVQEPASAFASFLNLFAHAYMYWDLIKKFPVKSTPVILLWHVFVIVCLHAWTWSIIFHTRDTLFTEFMDYSCALSMVISLFVAAILRILHRRRKLAAVILLLTVLYYVEHVRYLYRGQIDYDYNLYVNIFFGVAGCVAWSAWAGWQYVWGARHAWRVAAFCGATGAALALEVLDFPPAYGAWDAHALWHLCTAPLPLLFYRFVADDLHYLSAVGKSNVKSA